MIEIDSIEINSCSTDHAVNPRYCKIVELSVFKRRDLSKIGAGCAFQKNWKVFYQAVNA